MAERRPPASAYLLCHNAEIRHLPTSHSLIRVKVLP
jgi:hypothetical protein